jgi:hypothetical protein
MQIKNSFFNGTVYDCGKSIDVYIKYWCINDNRFQVLFLLYFGAL